MATQNQCIRWVRVCAVVFGACQFFEDNSDIVLGHGLECHTRLSWLGKPSLLSHQPCAFEGRYDQDIRSGQPHPDSLRYATKILQESWKRELSLALREPLNAAAPRGP